MRNHGKTFFSKVMYRLLRPAHLSLTQKVNFFRRLEALVEAGIDITAALRALAADAQLRSVRLVVQEINEAVQKGKPLYQAIELTKLFSDYTIAILRHGEEVGQLDEAILSISNHLSSRKELRGKVVSATAYPMLVFSVTILVGLSITWFILPQVANIFDSLNVVLPWYTQLLVQIGNLISEKGYIIAPVVIGVTFTLLYILFINRFTKGIGQRLLLNAPAVSQLMKWVEMADFGGSGGTMLRSGIDLPEMLDSMSEMTRLHLYRRAYKEMAARMREGWTFDRFFESKRVYRHIFPVPVREMLYSGESSGRLPEMLEFIHVQYKRESDVTAKTLSSLLEPVLIVGIWLGVLGLALSVIVPIYQVIGGFNTLEDNPNRYVEPEVTDLPVTILEFSDPFQAEEEGISESVSEEEVEDEVPEQVVTGKQYLVASPAGTLNLRLTADITSAVVQVLTDGDLLTGLDDVDENGWLHVVTEEGDEGYVSSLYVELQE